MSTVERVVAGRYRLVNRIGSGAMGVVWEAHDDRLGRTVAVKELLLAPGLSAEETDEAIQRAMREGRIAARLHHPNAIAVFDVVEEAGAPCLVMEYLPSRSLADVLAERGPLSAEEVARIGAQAAAALAAAHAAGIVHRDIKPGNVLLADNGTVKITDFGISRANDDVTVTKTGLIAGTPAYLAPEIARGQDPSPASDVFSLGSTLYAASEGEPPFGLSENTLGVLHAVAAGRINPPRQTGALPDVLVHLLAAEPEHRPTMAQTRELLAAVAAGRNPTLPRLPVPVPDEATALVGAEDRTRVVGAAAPTRAVTSPEPTRGRRGLVIVGLVAAAAVAVAGVLLASNLWTKKPSGGLNPVNDGHSTTPTAVQLPPAATLTTEQQAQEPEYTTTHQVPTRTQPSTSSVVPTTSSAPAETTTTNPPTSSSAAPPSTAPSSAPPVTTSVTK